MFYIYTFMILDSTKILLLFHHSTSGESWKYLCPIQDLFQKLTSASLEEETFQFGL